MVLVCIGILVIAGKRLSDGGTAGSGTGMASSGGAVSTGGGVSGGAAVTELPDISDEEAFSMAEDIVKEMKFFSKSITS